MGQEGAEWCLKPVRAVALEDGCISQGCLEKQNQQDIDTWEESYCRELAHTIMEPEKPHYLMKPDIKNICRNVNTMPLFSLVFVLKNRGIFC